MKCCAPVAHDLLTKLHQLGSILIYSTIQDLIFPIPGKITFHLFQNSTFLFSSFLLQNVCIIDKSCCFTDDEAGEWLWAATQCHLSIQFSLNLIIASPLPAFPAIVLHSDEFRRCSRGHEDSTNSISSDKIVSTCSSQPIGPQRNKIKIHTKNVLSQPTFVWSTFHPFSHLPIESRRQLSAPNFLHGVYCQPRYIHQ